MLGRAAPVRQSAGIGSHLEEVERSIWRLCSVDLRACVGHTMDRYLPRIVDTELDELFAGLAAISIEGPRGVGKTVTAARRAATIYRLDDPIQRQIAMGDTDRLVAGARPVLIDEWQRIPESWDLVRRAVDDDLSPGQFLLTGSAPPVEAPVHSGAGRIVTLRMRPLSLAERSAGPVTVSLRTLLSGHRLPVDGTTDVTLEGYVDEITRSGMPGIRRLADRTLRAQLDGYLVRIAEHDFPDMGREVRNPTTLRRWMTAYAAASSTTASYETIRDAASGGQGEKPARSTAQPYRDALEQLWIVEPVPAWLPTSNRIAHLSAPAKHQMADPALAARLLGIGAGALLGGHAGDPLLPRSGTLLGALFEGLVTLSLRTYAQAAEATVLHMRTWGGEREIDLIVRRDDDRVVAMEVKLARSVSDADVRHLLWLRDRIGDDLLDAVVITTGPQAYRRRDGIAVVPAALLGP